jgi:hypothetical protein
MIHILDNHEAGAPAERRATSKTATVEVLTAAVRVLMVGSRQITLSVLRQLDKVAYSECEPFGRVNDPQQNEHPHPKWVVGKHQADGTLVRADLGVRPSWGDDNDKWEQQTWSAINRVQRDAENYSRWVAEGIQSAFYQEKLAEVPGQLAKLEEELGFIQECKASTITDRAEYDKHLAAFRALPLIVLAGLK